MNSNNIKKSVEKKTKKKQHSTCLNMYQHSRPGNGWPRIRPLTLKLRLRRRKLLGSKGRKPTTIQHFIVQLRLCELQTTHHSGWLLQQHGLQLRLRGRGKKVRMCLGSTGLKGTNSIRCSPAMYKIKDVRIKTWKLELAPGWIKLMGW